MVFFGKTRSLKAAEAKHARVMEINVAVMNAIYDRSAGRWCAHCVQNGSHHTDQHNEFAEAAAIVWEARLRKLEDAQARR